MFAVRSLRTLYKGKSALLGTVRGLEADLRQVQSSMDRLVRRWSEQAPRSAVTLTLYRDALRWRLSDNGKRRYVDPFHDAESFAALGPSGEEALVALVAFEYLRVELNARAQATRSSLKIYRASAEQLRHIDAHLPEQSTLPTPPPAGASSPRG